MFQVFSSLTHTHKTLWVLIHHFYLFHFYPFIYTHGPLCHPMSNTQTKNNVIYLQSFNNTCLALTLLFHLILTCMSWLQPKKGGLHFILSDKGNYDFDVKVEYCRFVGFINDMVDYGCLGCVFCFRIKEKKKYTLYIKFYSIIFLQRFFFFFFFSLLQ